MLKQRYSFCRIEERSGELIQSNSSFKFKQDGLLNLVKKENRAMKRVTLFTFLIASLIFSATPNCSADFLDDLGGFFGDCGEFIIDCGDVAEDVVCAPFDGVSMAGDAIVDFTTSTWDTVCGDTEDDNALETTGKWVVFFPVAAVDLGGWCCKIVGGVGNSAVSAVCCYNGFGNPSSDSSESEGSSDSSEESQSSEEGESGEGNSEDSESSDSPSYEPKDDIPDEIRNLSSSSSSAGDESDNINQGINSSDTADSTSSTIVDNINGNG
jgi:hypothetical protein